MSPESDEMREEYDIRGGVRGKYYERYSRSVHISSISFQDSPLVAKSTATSTDIGTITWPVPYQTPLTSSTIRLGDPAVAR